MTHARRDVRLLVVAAWALLAPAALAWYAFTGARVDWAAKADLTDTPPNAWAFGLVAPMPHGASSALALVSYVVEHDRGAPAAAVIERGNRQLGAAPTGYRLAGRPGPHRIAVVRRRGVYFVCTTVALRPAPASPEAEQVQCAGIHPPLRYSGVVWTSGATLAAATGGPAYRAAAAAQSASPQPSPGTVAALAVDWTTHLGHGSQGGGAALVLALTLLAASGLAWLRRPTVARSRLRSPLPVAAIAAAVLVDVACRWLLTPGTPSADVPVPLVGVALGDASLHGDIGIWGNEGPLAAAVITLAVALAAATAVRVGSRLLLVAAALTVLGMLTNWGEVALRGYDTDYVWFGSAVRMTPFNLGDLYEFGGGLLVTWCCLRLVTGEAIPMSPSPPLAEREPPRDCRDAHPGMAGACPATSPSLEPLDARRS
ncbi:MAG TPA: hypothetical protein VGC71_05610 [Gaiellales bacterium]